MFIVAHYLLKYSHTICAGAGPSKSDKLSKDAEDILWREPNLSKSCFIFFSPIFGMFLRDEATIASNFCFSLPGFWFKNGFFEALFSALTYINSTQFFNILSNE